MSIYATIGTFKIPADELEVLGAAIDGSGDGEWIEVLVQGVPAHIGRSDQYDDDPYDEYLPPPLPEGSDLDYRAVLFVEQGTEKGGDGYGPQEYHDALLMLTGEEYANARLHEILERLHDNVDR